jgi:monoamine oxidase
LQARERVGGRTLTVPFAGRFIDLGAQWIGPQQRRGCALAKALGVATAEQSTRGTAQWSVGTMRRQLPPLQLLRLLVVL